jgi:hypothetical protein
MNTLKYRFLWTWDHSTNWSKKNIAIQEKGAFNPYLKSPDVFLEDYYLLLDFMESMDFNGLIIWGFFRDAHGGEKYAEKIIKYAKNKKIKILPGIGLGAYGGIYYEGNHPYNLKTYISKNPKLTAIDKNGNKLKNILCPSKEENIEWYLKGIDWLFDNFEIEGVNLETGDYGICWCSDCKKRRDEENNFSVGDIKVYLPVIEKIHQKSPYCLIIMALYIPPFTDGINIFFDLPSYIIPQWRLTEIIEEYPINYVNRETYLKFKDKIFLLPQKTQIGFFHQGSQWFLDTRHECVIKSIYNAVKFVKDFTFSGLITHGEVSAYESPEWFLNYLAFSYFTKNINSSIEDFAGILSKYVKDGREYISLLFSGNKKEEIENAIKYLEKIKYFTKYPWESQEYQLWRWLLKELYRRYYLLSQWEKGGQNDTKIKKSR